MNDDFRPDRLDDDSIEATRQKKMEEFARSFDKSALMGEYDDAAPASREINSVSYSDDSSETSFSTDPSSLRRRKKNNEINSYSDSDTRRRIERDSQKELKRQKKEEKKIEKSKAKRNRRMFKWVWLIMVIIVGVVLSQFLLVGVNDVLGISRDQNVRTVNISIPENPTITGIADILKQNDVIKKPEFFTLYAKLTSSEEGFRQGEFQLATNKDYEAIINALQSNSNRTDIVTVQITEGMSVLEIASLLHEEGVVKDIQVFLDKCNSSDFDEDYEFLKKIKNSDKRYYKLEGYLFPDTYDFYVGEDPDITIEKMLNNYETKIVNHKEKYFGNSKKSTLEQQMEKTGYSADQILTIASIIQAEAANRDDMYYISSILHNRLDYGEVYGVGQLNCDCTVYYPYRERTDVPESIRATYTSSYDTNTFNGLPPGPICNPGEEAIKAAIMPAESDYLYFCHDTVENGSVPYYSSTLEEHEYYLTIIGQ